MNFNLNIEDIKYLKILYKDSSEKGCTIKAAIKSINNREFLACAKYEDNIDIPAPQEIILSIVCSDGLYRTKTRMKSVELEEPYVFIALDSPVGLEYQQNREYFRINAEYNCTYSIDGRDFASKTFDISANGISILLPMHITSDNESEISINLEGRIIEAKIKYIRSEKVNTNHKLSFTFTEISDSDRDYISQVCIKKQLEAKRNARF